MASASHYLLDHNALSRTLIFSCFLWNVKLHYLLQYTMLPLEQVLTLRVRLTAGEQQREINNCRTVSDNRDVHFLRTHVLGLLGVEIVLFACCSCCCHPRRHFFSFVQG